MHARINQHTLSGVVIVAQRTRSVAERTRVYTRRSQAGASARARLAYTQARSAYIYIICPSSSSSRENERRRTQSLVVEVLEHGCVLLCLVCCVLVALGVRTR